MRFHIIFMCGIRLFVLINLCGTGSCLCCMESAVINIRFIFIDNKIKQKPFHFYFIYIQFFFLLIYANTGTWYAWNSLSIECILFYERIFIYKDFWFFCKQHFGLWTINPYYNNKHFSFMKKLSLYDMLIRQ